MDLPEEAEWIRRIKLGDLECFSRLYDRHHQRLYGLCFQFTRNEHDAEDQLQEIFMRLLAKIATFEGKSAFSTWITRLAVNQLINFRNRGRTVTTDSLSESLHQPQLRTESRVELSISLEQAVLMLPEGYRRVVILHDQMGLQHEEIADLLGIEAASSRSQLCRARLMLRETLKDCLAEIA